MRPAGPNRRGRANRADARAMAGLPNDLSDPSDYRRYVDYWGVALAWTFALFVALAVAGVALTVLVLRIGRAQHARIDRARQVALMPGAVVRYPASAGWDTAADVAGPISP